MQSTGPLGLKSRWRLHVEEAAKAHEEQNSPQRALQTHKKGMGKK